MNFQINRKASDNSRNFGNFQDKNTHKNLLDPSRGRNTRQFGKDVLNYTNANLDTRNTLKRDVKQEKHKANKIEDNCKLVQSESNILLNDLKPNAFSMELCPDSLFTIPIDLNDPVKTRSQHLQDRIDPQLVSEFYNEIKECLFTTEFCGDLFPIPNYISRIQSDINEKFRNILLDWIVEVHQKFKLLPETLFISINLIDRYLSIIPARKEELQCIGISCLLIASKYEEIYYPELIEFKKITDNSCSVKQILKTEFDILSALKFDITFPSALRFYEIFNQFLKLKGKEEFATHYLLEMSMLDYSMIKYRPSLIAAGCMMLVVSGNSMKKETLYVCCKHSMSDITNVCKDILAVYQRIGSGKMKSLKKKYSSKKYMEVSNEDIFATD